MLTGWNNIKNEEELNYIIKAHCAESGKHLA